MPSGVISDSARHVNSQVHNHSDSGRASVRAVAPSSSAATLSHQTSMREATRLLCGDQRKVKINAMVGTRISGMLLKWVNYGKGWRRRWFVLQDGVLSIYKVHGHDKVVVGQDAEEGWKVIGEKSLRRISGHNNGSSPLQRKPVAEVHLKVSSVHECKSDDKRFSIFTGTKRLHLRAETREDRLAWMNALQATKDMFPRTSNCDFVAPLDNVVVSTERLRQRLLEEGLSEATIHDSEQIMRSEFVALQNQIVQLDKKNWLLMETLQQLEVNVMTIRKRHANQNRDSSSVSSEKNSAHSSAFHSPQN